MIYNTKALSKANINCYEREDVKEIKRIDSSTINPTIVYSRNQKAFVASDGNNYITRVVEDETLLSALQLFKSLVESEIVSESSKSISLISDDRMRKCFFKDFAVDLDYRMILYEIADVLSKKDIQLNFYYVPYAFLSLDKYVVCNQSKSR